ncbi:hypothetical protein C8Q78DRAFT_237899 [Trametes maxima]|nr:hypothetical protein C8Q78DRAFT_237899 [Trametes maxima]
MQCPRVRCGLLPKYTYTRVYAWAQGSDYHDQSLCTGTSAQDSTAIYGLSLQMNADRDALLNCRMGARSMCNPAVPGSRQQPAISMAHAIRYTEWHWSCYTRRVPTAHPSQHSGSCGTQVCALLGPRVVHIPPVAPKSENGDVGVCASMIKRCTGPRRPSTLHAGGTSSSLQTRHKTLSPGSRTLITSIASAVTLDLQLLSIPAIVSARRACPQRSVHAPCPGPAAPRHVYPAVRS